MTEGYGPLARVDGWDLPDGRMITLSVYGDGLGPRIDPGQFGLLLESLGATPAPREWAANFARRLNGEPEREYPRADR